MVIDANIPLCSDLSSNHMDATEIHNQMAMSMLQDYRTKIHAEIVRQQGELAVDMLMAVAKEKKFQVGGPAPGGSELCRAKPQPVPLAFLQDGIQAKERALQLAVQIETTAEIAAITARVARIWRVKARQKRLRRQAGPGPRRGAKPPLSISVLPGWLFARAPQTGGAPGEAEGAREPAGGHAGD